MFVRKSNPPFLNGVPEMLILQLLSERSMHGYELVQAIRKQTDSRLEFGEGCIYPILHRLESDGLLGSRRQMVSGRSRVVYRMTTKGKQRLAESIRGWRQVVDAVDCCLQGGQRARPALA